MKNKTEHFHYHFSHYVFLFILLGFELVLFFIQSGNPQLQSMIIYSSAVLYFFWGILHHHFEGDLMPKVVVEYLLISLLAVLLLRGAFIR